MVGRASGPGYFLGQEKAEQARVLKQATETALETLEELVCQLVNARQDDCLSQLQFSTITLFQRAHMCRSQNKNYGKM